MRTGSTPNTRLVDRVFRGLLSPGCKPHATDQLIPRDGGQWPVHVAIFQANWRRSRIPKVLQSGIPWLESVRLSNAGRWFCYSHATAGLGREWLSLARALRGRDPGAGARELARARQTGYDGRRADGTRWTCFRRCWKWSAARTPAVSRSVARTCGRRSRTGDQEEVVEGREHEGRSATERPASLTRLQAGPWRTPAPQVQLEPNPAHCGA